MFKTLRVSNINSNYYDKTDERYTTSNDLTTTLIRASADRCSRMVVQTASYTTILSA